MDEPKLFTVASLRAPQRGSVQIDSAQVLREKVKEEISPIPNHLRLNPYNDDYDVDDYPFKVSSNRPQEEQKNGPVIPYNVNESGEKSRDEDQRNGIYTQFDNFSTHQNHNMTMISGVDVSQVD